MAAPAISSPTSIGAKLATTVGAYVALTKPRIIELLLVTTVPVMVVADQGVPPLWLMAAAVIGGTLAAGGANAINMYVDRDIDSVMERTQGRPLVTGAVTPRNALVFAVTIEVVAFVFLWQVVNLLSAVLAVSGCLYYVFIYTLWLKRSSRQNIVIGGAAGAVPVLVGWSAVTDTVSISAIVLFGVIFFWTPPHFWALAIKYKDDYARADVPMLPSVASHRQTTDQILAYTVVVWALTLLFGVTAEMGLLYWATAIVLGAVFTWMAVDLRRTESPARAIRVFTFSITYITVLFGVMALDVIIRNGW
ncbi:MAG TPA: heme o synthase [Microthrixaceae bacterium]|nr:protoheme IX farnesyltransferase [Microthrixaceae bacterium]HMU79109.1 heme o synthase [Microthrixaceae bacterium]HMX05910.1 heme o synthase [Microthrixaceae bacterium]HMY86750.1 heme o synthase [Microthrixaceae bacterium]HNA35529.1 heme o synthase [Microthrixaceae bacterium]